MTNHEKFDSSHESEEKITREEVIKAYSKFIDQGIKSPDKIDPDDPVHEPFYKWIKQENALAEGDEELKIRADLSQTIFYVDAGFTDPKYLDEVLNDWLAQTDEDVKEEIDNPERVETRKLIAKAMQKIENLLAEQN